MQGLEKYTQQMSVVREAIQKSETARKLTEATTAPDQMLLWLINFSSRGVRMTAPVEGWIRRAGERCQELGFEDVGRQLVKHASQEHDHHLMMIEDTIALVNRWNSTHEEQLDATTLLERPATPSVQAYIDLHEDIIASEQPYRQVAIEREIEGLSLALGPSMIGRCRDLLGMDGLSEVSFITDHVELDVGHTAFNEKLLKKLFDAAPETVDAMIEAGTAALTSYLGFMTDCLDKPVMASVHAPTQQTA